MKKLVALDLDGTLTQHKTKLEFVCRKTLEELTQAYHLVMICAGSCERVYRQMDKFPVDIIGFYGMEYSRIVNGRLQYMNKVSVKNNKAEIMEKINIMRKESGLTNYYGESVEFHCSGIITFPLLGTAASQEHKLSFDPDRHIRRRYYKEVCELFENYNVFIGGSSSFDMAPKPYRKLYALEQYLDNCHINRSQVIYFGDDYGYGGNDSDIYHSDISFIKIDNYHNFPQIAKDVLL